MRLSSHSQEAKREEGPTKDGDGLPSRRPEYGCPKYDEAPNIMWARSELRGNVRMQAGLYTVCKKGIVQRLLNTYSLLTFLTYHLHEAGARGCSIKNTNIRKLGTASVALF